jgi:hypothetical protein
MMYVIDHVNKNGQVNDYASVFETANASGVTMLVWCKGFGLQVLCW